MSKKAYIGISTKARTVKNIYIGVGNKARKVIKAYVGDENGKARQWWPSVEKLVRLLFNDGFKFHTHFVQSRTEGFSLADADNTKYSTGDITLYDWMFTGYNVVIDGTGTHGPLKPLLYTYGTGEFAEKKVLKTQNITVSSDTGVNIYIPTLMFGLSRIQFVISGGSFYSILRFGIGVRVQDEEQELPNTVSGGYLFEWANQSNVTVSLDCNDIRADYIYLKYSNSVFSTGYITINRIVATYERTYGIVINTLSPIGQPYQPAKYYLNYPKFGFLVGSFFEFSIKSATSAVWTLVFNTDNYYDGDNIYADVDSGNYWGTGDTYFILISKKPFVVAQSWNDNTVNSSSTDYNGKAVYYYFYILPEYFKRGSPMHSYAYTRYEGWNTNDESVFARMGYNLFYAGLFIE